MKTNKYLLLSVVICILFFLPLFAKSEIITTKDNDLGRNYMPLFSYIHDSFVNYKQIPLWRTDQMMGGTFVGDPLSSLFYPLNIIFLFTPTKFALTIYLFLNFALAAIFTFYLAKSYKLSNLAAMSAAIFYAFSIKMLVHFEAGHVTMLTAFVFIPLSFVAFKKIQERFDINYLIVGTVALAIIYFEYPSIFYYTTLFLCAYFIYKQFPEFNSIRLRTINAVTFFAVTFGLIAIALFPHLEFSPISTRSQLKLEDVAIPLWNFKKFILSLFFPYPLLTKLNHEEFLYLGVAPSILSVIGFLKLSKYTKLTLLFFGIITLLFVLGLSSPIFPIAYKLMPFLNYSRVTTRLWIIVALLVSLLAAKAIDNIKNKKFAVLLISLFLFESTMIFHLRFKQVPILSFENESMYQFLAADKEIFRVYCTTACLDSQMLSKYHIENLAGETPIQNLAFINFLQKAGNYNWNNFAVIFPPYQTWQVESPPIPNAQVLGQANVKYVISPYKLESDRFEYISIFKNLNLYENLDFKTRAYFETTNRKIEISHYSPNSISLSFARTPNSESLVISQNYFPGWYAFIDGLKFETTSHDSTFAKITVPPSTDKIELKYQPRSFLIGKTITFGTILFLGLYFWYSRKKEIKN